MYVCTVCFWSQFQLTPRGETGYTLKRPPVTHQSPLTSGRKVEYTDKPHPCMFLQYIKSVYISKKWLFSLHSGQNKAAQHCVTNSEWRDGGKERRKRGTFLVGMKMYVPPIRRRQMWTISETNRGKSALRAICLLPHTHTHTFYYPHLLSNSRSEERPTVKHTNLIFLSLSWLLILSHSISSISFCSIWKISCFFLSIVYLLQAVSGHNVKKLCCNLLPLEEGHEERRRCKPLPEQYKEKAKQQIL